MHKLLNEITGATGALSMIEFKLNALGITATSEFGPLFHLGALLFSHLAENGDKKLLWALCVPENYKLGVFPVLSKAGPLPLGHDVRAELILFEKGLSLAQLVHHPLGWRVIPTDRCSAELLERLRPFLPEAGVYSKDKNDVIHLHEDEPLGDRSAIDIVHILADAFHTPSTSAR
jgi:hypothetical protein